MCNKQKKKFPRKLGTVETIKCIALINSLCLFTIYIHFFLFLLLERRNASNLCFVYIIIIIIVFYRLSSASSLKRGQQLRAPSPGAGSMYHASQVSHASSRRGSFSSEPADVAPSHVQLAKDHYKYWYKPHISREEAIALLRPRPPGTFVVRDSNSFPGAFGLALKVATPPVNAPPPQAVSTPGADAGDELIRHFLIEPTSKGVKLKGYSNEPVFSSLSALVYQHTVTPLALPSRLILPEMDLTLHNNPERNSTDSR